MHTIASLNDCRARRLLSKPPRLSRASFSSLLASAVARSSQAAVSSEIAAYNRSVKDTQSSLDKPILPESNSATASSFLYLANATKFRWSSGRLSWCCTCSVKERFNVSTFLRSWYSLPCSIRTLQRLVKAPKLVFRYSAMLVASGGSKPSATLVAPKDLAVEHHTHNILFEPILVGRECRSTTDRRK